MAGLLKTRNLFVKLMTGGLSPILLIGVLWAGTTSVFNRQTARADDARTSATRISYELLEAKRYEKEFMLYDLINPEFYQNGSAFHYDMHEAAV